MMQSMMNDYIDYRIDDATLVKAYQLESTDWVLITLVLLQGHCAMLTSDIQKKVDSLSLGAPINVVDQLQRHNIEPSPFAEVVRESPRIFKEFCSNKWYVDFVRVQHERPDFHEKFLKNAGVTQRYSFVTFHQSYSYEDFIEGIRPEYIPATKGIDYSPKPGVFKQLCTEAAAHPEKSYAIFIDEINRGNISEIFGELISLIEIGKRDGECGALSAVLPYSKTKFSVPSNVNLYGTMNTADRSIDQIDIALRRRFKFIPMRPDTKIIKDEMELSGFDANNIEGIDLIKLVETINARIELLLDSQHLLGHALFLGATNVDKIASVIRNSVIPLLEEYFYEDIQKIQLVFNDLDTNGDLRENAIYTHESLTADVYFPYTGDYVIDDKKHFKVADSITAESLKHIYE